jgi:hypothetical protein
MKKITRLWTRDRFCLSDLSKGSITLSSPTHFTHGRALMREPPWNRRQDQSGRKALDLLTGFFEGVHETRIANG